MSDPHKHAADDAELTDYADLINNLRAGQTIDPVQPSAGVWASISSSLDSPAAGSPAVDGSAADKPAAASNQHAEGAPVIDLGAARERSRGRTAAILVAVAAAFLLVAVPVGLALRGDDADVELASAELLVLDEAAAEDVATASLVSKGSDLFLELETEDIALDGTDFAELWLLRVDDDGNIEPISLGRADGSGRYDVDDDLDLDATWLVDVSIEPDDGDHEHSGHSVLQGDLTVG